MDEILNPLEAKQRIEDLESQVLQLRNSFYKNNPLGVGGAVSGISIRGEKSDTLFDKDIKNKFGGDGSDGELVIASGTTTLDINSVAFYERNYTRISITGTGKLAFSNPNANGTIVVLRSTGDVTLTSSDSAVIDCSSLGAAASANQGI